MSTPPNWLYQMSRSIAVALMLVAIALPFARGQLKNPDGLFFYCVMQALLGGFLFYTSMLKLQGSELSHKLYPASIAATVLYLLMMLRWLTTTAN